MKATNFTRKMVLADKVETAGDFAKRLVGLISTPDFKMGTGLLIVPCSAIHTWFMRYPIDVIFLNRENQVLKVVHSIPPFQFGPLVRGAAKALELPAGVCRTTGTEFGDAIRFTCEE